MEAALKIARQYFVEIGQPQRSMFIARRQSYHGNTLGALAVGGNAWRRRQFAPLLIDVTHVAPCYQYRDRSDDETPAVYGVRLAEELDDAIVRCGPRASSPSSPRRSAARPPVPCRRCRDTSARSARSATVTGCSSSRTK